MTVGPNRVCNYSCKCKQHMCAARGRVQRCERMPRLLAVKVETLVVHLLCGTTLLHRAIPRQLTAQISRRCFVRCGCSHLLGYYTAPARCWSSICSAIECCLLAGQDETFNAAREERGAGSPEGHSRKRLRSLSSAGAAAIVLILYSNS